MARQFVLVNHQFRRVARVLISAISLALLAGVPLVLCERALNAPAPHRNRPGPQLSMPANDFGKLLVRLDKQKDQRAQWAYAALVAIVAISVVKKVFTIPGLQYAYMLLGPAGVLMLESIRAGYMYEQRVAGLISTPMISEVAFYSVNMLWLYFAVSILLFFVAFFLVTILSRNLTMENEDASKSHSCTLRIVGGTRLRRL